ncbi:aspartate ammonia-lyase [Nocardioides sp. LMS-CY]|uniref:aspartate ammonia-lyase n=1 Tax=Nocardioides sp. (strain LMS-CY) TaxID=2840457 RepID=UPI001C003D36|nr:aspartate ammonia-lyase [Nocardioides sp. LMS-CY]QWF23905.1 aspartate ammonia-lyase [Nocardioides sp. LMS-CY]
MTRPDLRVEHDLIGELEIPAGAYWGINTARALQNFDITGTPIAAHPALIESLAGVKQAAAMANRDLGLLDEQVADAVIAACLEIRQGRLRDSFVVDVLQGGAGTSTNMNANEVIANRALELLGEPRGSYAVVHPNEHVNLGQSTNDVYPTALRLGLRLAVHDLVVRIEALATSFERRADDIGDVLKLGRTQLQDAVPMTVGQEFRAFAATLREDRARIDEVVPHLLEVNLGGTAIGTGLNAHHDYRDLVRHYLARITGLPVRTAPDLIEATQDCGVFVLLSSMLKRYAVKLSKICNDLRLLASGPRGGFHELNLPERQAGSSIMPGKVNPVIPELVNQVAFEVIGNDLTVTMAAEAGQLQLNAFEPVIGHTLFRSIDRLGRASTALATRCVDGITVNEVHLRAQVESSIGLVTALSPMIGYERATEAARLALASDRGVLEVVVAEGWLSAAEADAAVTPTALGVPTRGRR